MFLELGKTADGLTERYGIFSPVEGYFRIAGQPLETGLRPVFYTNAAVADSPINGKAPTGISGYLIRPKAMSSFRSFAISMGFTK